MDLVTSRCSQPAFKPAQRTHRRCYASAAHPKPSSDISVSEPQVQAQAQVQAVPRRTVLLQTAAAAVACLVPARPSSAAPGLDFLTRGFPSPPTPCLFPRRALNQKFAVLLMRSAYDSLDELDIVAMNKFQKDFWKLRQSEQEAYNLAYEPIKVRLGDLTDPNYFDYISYAQTATISNQVAHPEAVFQEFCEECEGGYRVVRRDNGRYSDAELPAVLRQRTGELIYVGLRDGFRGEVFNGPQPAAPGASVSEVREAVRALVDVMCANGFALKGEVSAAEGGEAGGGRPVLTVRTQGSCNLWGLAALSFRRSNVVNDYVGTTVSAFLSASGHPPSSYQLSYDESSTEHVWVL